MICNFVSTYRVLQLFLFSLDFNGAVFLIAKYIEYELAYCRL